jgi:TonB family protein
VSIKNSDISQIRKYLKGELDAHAMHEVERRALDDPFMSDALEGFELVKNDEDLALNELSERLKKRVQSDKKPILLWRYAAIAASVLIVFAIGGVGFYQRDAKPEPAAVAMLDRDKTAIKPQVETPVTPPYDLDEEQTISSSKAGNQYTQVSKKRHAQPVDAVTNAAPAPLSELEIASAPPPASNSADSTSDAAVIGYGTASRKDIAANASKLKEAKSEERYLEKAVQGRVAGIQTAPATVIKGVVLDEQGKLPLPGVSVHVEGVPVATRTNANGQFSIQVPDVKSYLLFDYIGYERKRARAKASDSLNIVLKSDTRALSEVVVTAYSSQQEAIKKAHPRSGWDSYNKHLKEGAVSPDGKKGTVRISFVVNTNGELSNFKILKSLSKETDEIAIDLVKDGSEWMPDTDGKAKEVRLKIKFH